MLASSGVVVVALVTKLARAFDATSASWCLLLPRRGISPPRNDHVVHEGVGANLWDELFLSASPASPLRGVGLLDFFRSRFVSSADVPSLARRTLEAATSGIFKCEPASVLSAIVSPLPRLQFLDFSRCLDPSWVSTRWTSEV